MRARLGTTSAKSGGLHHILVKAQCIDITKELLEVSSKCVASIKGNTCTDQSLQEEVVAVYRALEEAFHQCMQKGIGKAFFEIIWQEDGARSADVMVMSYCDNGCPRAFNATIAMSIVGIRGAAARALEDLEQNGCKGHHEGARPLRA